MPFCRTIVLLTIAAAAAIAPTAVAQPSAVTYAERTLTPAQSAADVALLREALETVHAGYGRYRPKRFMDSLFTELNARLSVPRTDLQLYQEVALLVARIRCNHTKAEYPAALQHFREEHATQSPVRVRVFDERLFVDTSAGNAIARGSEIVSINGIRAAAIVSTLGRYAAVDGFTDFARASLLESDDDLMASNLEHYWPVQYGFAKEWTYVVRSSAGVERTTTLQPIKYDAWMALGGGPRQVDFTNGTSWRMLDSTTALLTIRSFVNYRTPINADSLYTSIFGQLRTRGATHLILDLRENGGGSDDASSGLIRWLADRPVQPNTSVRRRTINITGPLATAFETWGNRAAVFTPAASLFEQRGDGWYYERDANAVLAPSPDAFTGRVSVLMGRRNGSGATMLLAVLQEMGARTGRLRLVGEESGGSAEGPTAGQILSLKLPNSGMRVRIPLKRSDVNVTTFVPGLGVFPDVDATETLADFRARIDKALLFARVTPWRRNTSPLAPTVGLMRGELEYLDYTSGKRTTLQTWMHTSPIGNTGAFRQRTIYDDGPGKTIYTADVVTVSGDRWIEGETGRGRQSLRVVSRNETPAGQQLRLQGSGVDDDTPVDFRYTVTLSPTSYTRVKEFRPRGKTGAPFTFRHVYRFQRTSQPR